MLKSYIIILIILEKLCYTNKKLNLIKDYLYNYHWLLSTFNALKLHNCCFVLKLNLLFIFRLALFKT